MKDQIVSRFGRAISHPARVFILRMLHEKGEMYFYEIVAHTPLKEGTVTEHLRRLRQAELIRVRDEGQFNVYSLHQEGIRKMNKTQRTFIKEILDEDVDDRSEAA